MLDDCDSLKVIINVRGEDVRTVIEKHSQL